MANYFKSWRRKIGLVTLLMALASAGGWVRSGWIADGIWYPTETSNYFIDSLHGVIRLYKGTHDAATPIFRGRRFSFSSENAWSASHINLDDNGESLPFDPWGKLEVIWRSDWLGISIGVANLKNANTKVEMCVIHYRTITIPLTLISLWLLLSKSRHVSQKKTSEPIAETAA